MEATTTTTDLQHTLDGVADRIASRGTQIEAATLAALAAAAQPLCPGAADALVDWEGPEVARLRAFAVVHRTLLRHVAAVHHAVLVDVVAAPPAAVAA